MRSAASGVVETKVPAIINSLVKTPPVSADLQRCAGLPLLRQCLSSKRFR
jgi:hypothetical protein